MANESYGPILDVWSALVMGRGDLAPLLKQETEAAVSRRGLPRLTVEYATVTKDGKSPDAQYKPALVFRQDVGAGGIATMCLHVEQKGEEDLEIEWWIAAINIAHRKRAQAMATFGVMMSIAGFLAGGLNLALGNQATGHITNYTASRTGKTALDAWEQAGLPTQEHVTQTLALAHTVDYCLMRVLSNHDVDASQLRVTHPSKYLKIGHLADG